MFLAPQKHGARQNDGCVNPSFSRILTRTRFAPYALGQALLPRNRRDFTRISCYRSSWVSYLVSMLGTVTFAGSVSRIFTASLRGGLATWFDVRTHLVVGRPRIARGVPWAGSVTGGEACGYRCSEKEGFTHRWFWRAPCFWGAKNIEAAR